MHQNRTNLLSKVADKNKLGQGGKWSKNGAKAGFGSWLRVFHKKEGVAAYIIFKDSLYNFKCGKSGERLEVEARGLGFGF